MFRLSVSRSAGAAVCKTKTSKRVAAGELVATIQEPFGRVVERLEAPVSGVVLGLRHLCSVRAGEGVMCVLEERMLE